MSENSSGRLSKYSETIRSFFSQFRSLGGRTADWRSKMETKNCQFNQECSEQMICESKTVCAFAGILVTSSSQSLVLENALRCLVLWCSSNQRVDEMRTQILDEQAWVSIEEKYAAKRQCLNPVWVQIPPVQPQQQQSPFREEKRKMEGSKEKDGKERQNWDRDSEKKKTDESSLTSWIISWAAMAFKTLFLLVSWTSPPIISSSRMKYAFSKLKMMSSSQTDPKYLKRVGGWDTKTRTHGNYTHLSSSSTYLWITSNVSSSLSSGSIATTK